MSSATRTTSTSPLLRYIQHLLSRLFSITLALLYTPFDLAIYLVFSMYHLARTHLNTLALWASRLLETFYNRAVPRAMQAHISVLASIARQLSHLVLGRLLPDLTPAVSARASPRARDRTQLHSLRGKHAIVTGANSGIGLHIALALAKRGATVVLACRSQSRAAAARQHILWNVPEAMGRVSTMALDTADLDAVKLFTVAWAEVFGGLATADNQEDDDDGGGDDDAHASPPRNNRRIDILVHNAGIAHTDKDLVDDGDGAGIEALYATNFLGSFLLTYLLEPYLAADARVIFTTSTAQLWARFNPNFALGPVRGLCEPGFHAVSTRVPLLGWEWCDKAGSSRYAMTKAMQCAMARCLQKKWDAQYAAREETKGIKSARSRRTAHAFTPGFTETPIFAKFETASWSRDFFRDPTFTLMRLGTSLATDVEQGAATGVWLACSQDPAIRECGGGYWDRMRREFSVADRMDDRLLGRLWTRWERDAGVEWT